MYVSKDRKKKRNQIRDDVVSRDEMRWWFELNSRNTGYVRDALCTYITPCRSAEACRGEAAVADRLGRDIGQRGQLRERGGRADCGIIPEDSRPMGERARSGESPGLCRTFKRPTAMTTRDSVGSARGSQPETGSCSTSWASFDCQGWMSRIREAGALVPPETTETHGTKKINLSYIVSAEETWNCFSLEKLTRSQIRPALNLSLLTMCYAKSKLRHKFLRKVDEWFAKRIAKRGNAIRRYLKIWYDFPRRKGVE